MRDPEFWYGLLKVLSFIAAGAFGALGLLSKYKDDDGRITRAGKVALAGIVLSGILSLSMFILETTKAKLSARRAQAEADATARLLQTILLNARTTAEQQRTTLRQTQGLATQLESTADLQRINVAKANDIAADMDRSMAAQEALQQSNRQILSGVERSVEKQVEMMSVASNTLRETQRLLHPIDALEMRVHITIPRSVAGLSEYLSRVAPVLDPIGRNLNPLGNWNEVGIQELQRLELLAPMPGAIGIPLGSQYHPSRERDGRIADIVSIQAIELAFYRDPIEPALFSPFDARPDQEAPPDIRAVLRPKEADELLLHFFGSQSHLGLRGDLVSDPNTWTLSGELMSVDDLPDGQLYLTLGWAGRAVGEYDMDRLTERGEFIVSTIFLRIAKREIVIDGKHLTRYVDRSGIPFWVVPMRHIWPNTPKRPAT